MEQELKSCLSDSEPVKPHVHCLCLFRSKLVVYEAFCCGFSVCIGVLRVSHFYEYIYEVDSFFFIDKEPS